MISDRVFTVITSLALAILAALDPSYPAATSILTSTLTTLARIQQTFRFGKNSFTEGQAKCYFSQNCICSQGGISKWYLDPQLLLTIRICFLTLVEVQGVFSKSIAGRIAPSQGMECWKTPCELISQCSADIMER